MTETSAPTAIVPTLCYHDLPAAVEFLRSAFGFELRLRVDDEEGAPRHVQLAHGPVMVMLSPAREDDFGQYQRTPKQFGAGTQSPYLVVADVDAWCERAQSAGARVVLGPVTEAHGRMFSCQDPEGHLWNFGDYDPWQPLEDQAD